MSVARLFAAWAPSSSALLCSHVPSTAARASPAAFRFPRELVGIAGQGVLPRSDLHFRPAGGFDRRVVALDAGRSRGKLLARGVSPRAAIQGQSPGFGLGRFAGGEVCRSAGFLVPRDAERGLGLAERELEGVVAEPRDPGPLRAERRRLLRVPLRLGRLTFQGRARAFDFREDVGEAGQVRPGFFEFELGRAFLDLVFRDARGLFDELAAIERLRREHLVDLALLDDRVRADAEPRAEQHVLDVLESHLPAVQVVLAFALAVDAAADRDAACRSRENRRCSI